MLRIMHGLPPTPPPPKKKNATNDENVKVVHRLVMCYRRDLRSIDLYRSGHKLWSSTINPNRHRYVKGFGKIGAMNLIGLGFIFLGISRLALR